MNFRALVVLAVLFSALSATLAACGGDGGTTTVIKEAPTTIEKTTTVQVPAPQSKPSTTQSKAPTTPTATTTSESASSPPNVVGLPLPAAQQMLKEAGFQPAVRNTDTAFGIVVPSNFTVCKQDSPRGSVVPILAQKYGC